MLLVMDDLRLNERRNQQCNQSKYAKWIPFDINFGYGNVSVKYE